MTPGNGTEFIVSNLPAGDYGWSVSVGGVCNSLSSFGASIRDQPKTPSTPTVGTITLPTCTTAGSVVLNGLPAGVWYINPGGISGNTSSTTIPVTGGTYSWTVQIGECTSAPSQPVNITPPAGAPSAPILGTITQPTCLSGNLGSVELKGLPSGNWTIMPGNITGTGSSYTFTQLAPGQYTWTVTAGGCTSGSSAIATLLNLITHTVTPPVLGTISDATCSAGGSVLLTGLPSGTWALERFNSNQPYTSISVSGSGSSYLASGLPAGSYNWTIHSGICVSGRSAPATINASPGAPVVYQTIDPSCLQLCGLPAGKWTINPGNVVDSGSCHTLCNLAPGMHSWTVTNAMGCTSVPSIPFVITGSDPGLTLKLTAAIQGYLNATTSLMNMTDKIKVILRANVAPAYAALDSAIVNLDSSSLSATMTFYPSTTAASYYIVIKHRNSVETWSIPVTFTGGSLSYNFTDAATKAYGNNLIQKGAKFCIYGADVNQDRVVDLKDSSPIQNAINNFFVGYLPTDTNGDQFVDLKDSSVEFNNQSNYVRTLCPICN
jgi:hypothetical protein